MYPALLPPPHKPPACFRVITRYTCCAARERAEAAGTSSAEAARRPFRAACGTQIKYAHAPRYRYSFMVFYRRGYAARSAQRAARVTSDMARARPRRVRGSASARGERHNASAGRGILPRRHAMSSSPRCRAHVYMNTGTKQRATRAVDRSITSRRRRRPRYSLPRALLCSVLCTLLCSLRLQPDSKSSRGSEASERQRQA